MRRLLATMRLDVRLQVRNGFYAATAVVLVVWVVLGARLPSRELGWLLPALVLGNLMMNTFYFVAGLVLLERAEGTTHAVAVTPLRPREYLCSKVVTLALLALAENLVVAALVYGPHFRVVPLAAALVLAAGVYALSGFLAVARFDSVNEFLMPSMVYTAVLSLPLVVYLAGWSFWPVYAHPLQGPLDLAVSAFEPVPPWRVAVGTLSSVLWAVALLRACLSAFDRHLAGRGGA